MPRTREHLQQRCRAFLEAQSGYQPEVDWIEQQLDDELLENLTTFVESLLSPAAQFHPDTRSWWRRFMDWLDAE